eukprot:356453-Chlamydomonas_euryale.AAC.3
MAGVGLDGQGGREECRCGSLCWRARAGQHGGTSSAFEEGRNGGCGSRYGSCGSEVGKWREEGMLGMKMGWGRVVREETT